MSPLWGYSRSIPQCMKLDAYPLVKFIILDGGGMVENSLFLGEVGGPPSPPPPAPP